MPTMKQRIRAEVSRLEFAQFRYPDDKDERDRLNEICKLARQQMIDDVYTTDTPGWGQARVGDRPVYRLDDEDGTMNVWDARTPDQLALEAGFAPLIAKLSGENRVLVRMRYAAQLTTREIGEALNVNHSTVLRRLEKLHDELRTALLAAFVKKEE